MRRFNSIRGVQAAVLWAVLGSSPAISAAATEDVPQVLGGERVLLALVTTVRDASTIVKGEESIQLDSGVPQVDLDAVRKLLRDKQYDRAIKAIETLESKRTPNVTLLNLKGSAYLAKKDLGNARKAFERAESISPQGTIAALNLGQLDIAEGKPEVARKRFETILATQPNSVEVMVGLAGVAAAQGKDADYVAWLEKAVKAGPTLVGTRVMLAQHYLSKSAPRKALPLAQEAVTLSPSNAEALEVLGSAQLAVAERDKAVDTYARLARLTPNDPVVQYKLAMAHAAANNISPARSALGRALAMKPDYLEAKILLSTVELGAGRFGDALRIAREIQKQHPEHSAGYSLEGDALIGQRQPGPALKAYEKAFSLQKSGFIVVNIHRTLVALGNEKEAQSRIESWLREQPNDVPVRRYLAFHNLQTGQTKPAMEHLQLLVQASPNEPSALNNLAWLYLQQRDPRALAMAQRAQQLRPDDPEIMDTVGWIQVQQGDAVQGIELLRKAVEAAPKSASIRYHLAAGLVKSGDKFRARKELQTLLETTAAFPERQDAEALFKQLGSS